MKHKFVELAELVAKALDNLDEGLHGDLIESQRFSERMQNFRNTVWDIRILAERVKKKIEEESYQNNLPDATMNDLF